MIAAKNIYKGTSKLKEQGFYKSTAWRHLRLLALQRDNYLCRECLRSKRITKAAEVHHVKLVSSHPELALTLDNLESLCHDCHEKTKQKRHVTDDLPVRVIRMRDSGDDVNKRCK